jgi:hypothetical protein
MGLFDFFKSKTPEQKVEKIVRRLLEEYSPQEARQQAMQELVENGTDDAIYGLVSRLGFNLRDSIKNEQEKAWINGILIDRFQARSIAPLKKWITHEENISAAIDCLSDLITKEELKQFLMETLKQYLPEDHRKISVRSQLIDALRDLDGLEIVFTVAPYLLDHDDDVRIKSIALVQEKLVGEEGDFSMITQALIEVIFDPNMSGRIIRAAAKCLSVLQINLSEYETALLAQMPDGFILENGKLKAGK